VTLPARAENVGVVRHVLGAVGEALGIDHGALDDLRLAVSEACANAVVHAYPEGEGLLFVDLDVEQFAIDIAIRDSGVGMAPRPDSPGLGVGLPLMASLSSSLELVANPEGGTEVRMRFELTGDHMPAHDGALR
jgi:serine/threonine-protein kinase RsbW/stage II sporulation protein AB (anti-sigma F factor)